MNVYCAKPFSQTYLFLVSAAELKIELHETPFFSSFK